MIDEAVWLTALAALLDLIIVEGHWFLVGTVSTLQMRTNHHHLWMRPLALTLLMMPLGLVAAYSLHRRPARKLAAPLTRFLLCFLACLSPLWALEELHGWSSVALALGLGRCLDMALRRWGGLLLALGRWPLIGASILAIGVGAYRNALAGPLSLAALPTADTKAPNLALIVLDTVRADHLDLHGYERPTMPLLKRRAEEQVWFEEARSTAPWTLPSHASMFTGRWHHELSVDTVRSLDDEHTTIAEHLAGRGYRTAGFAANTTYCNAWFGLDRGFHHYEDALENQAISLSEVMRSSGLGLRIVRFLRERHVIKAPGDSARKPTGEEVVTRAVDWFDRQDGDQPAFLFVNLFDAHGPYVVPDGFPRRFLTSENEVEFRKVVKKMRQVAGKAWTDESERVEAALSQLGLDAYDDCLRYLDQHLDRLLTELERLGRARGRETWVVITSDHGEHFGERGLHRHGNSLYRPVLHVPLIVLRLGGEAPAGPALVTAPVSLRDLPQTFAELAGRDVSAGFPGRSLARFWMSHRQAEDPAGLVDPVLSGLHTHPALVHRGPTPKYHPGSRFYHALVHDQQTYIELMPEGEALYDLATDREEAADWAISEAALPALGRFREVLRDLTEGQPR